MTETEQPSWLDDPIIEEETYVVGRVKWKVAGEERFAILFEGDEKARIVDKDIIEETPEWELEGDYLYETITKHLCPECKREMFKDEQADERFCVIHD